MLNAVIRFALRYRLVVVVASLAVLVYGGYVTATLPLDVFPDLDRPRVVVMTEVPALAPEDVETQVTFPIESAVLGANGVQAVRSQSGLGLSVVSVEFDWGANIYVARQTVQERLSTAADQLPPGAKPVLAPIGSVLGQIMQFGMHRRTGPHGGQLAPVGKTPLMAELVHEPDAGRVSLYLLEVRYRTRPSTWQPVQADGKQARLTWAKPGEKIRPAADLPGVTLAEEGGDRSRFTATDPRLKRGYGEEPFADLERRVTISVKGQTHDLDFPTRLQQHLNLRTIADWVVRPRLLKIAGISQVMVVGGGRKQYQVLVNPDALLTYDVTLQEVEDAVRRNNLNVSGGYALDPERERPIRILGRLGPEPRQVLQDLREIPVKTTPKRTILLEQVARVVEGPQIKRGDAAVNGEPGVILNVNKQPHRDTRQLTDEVKAAIREVEATQPADIAFDTDLFEVKRFIDTGVYNVAEALGIGAMLVLIVLFLFLLNFRTTFISLAAIPLSLVITGLVFKLVGWISGTPMSVNVMTLGGIAVAMGELVDDAIVDVENIFRRLKENNALPEPRSPLQVIYAASIEVRGAIVFGTLMVILVFLPLFALSGIEGRLFAPLGVAYIVSILASLLVSLTVTPVLSYYLLPQARATHREQDSPVLRLLKWLASYVVRFSMNHAGSILLCAWVLVGAAAWSLTQLGSDFLPPFDEGSVQVTMILPAGSSLEASNKAGEILDANFRRMQKSEQNPDGVILQFMRRAGRAELDEHADPPNVTDSILTINPHTGRTRQEIIDQILKQLKEEIPDADLEVEQPMAHQINEMMSGVTAQIAIKIQGDDLDKLRAVAEHIKAVIRGIDGLTPPVIEAQELSDEMHIRPRQEQLAYYGVNRDYVANFLGTALRGEEVSQVIEGQRRFDLVVRLDEPYRSDYANLGRLRLELPDHRRVPVSELADIGEGVGPNIVKRENVRRRLVVRCNVLGRDLGSVVDDIKERVDEQVKKKGKLPEGYSVDYGGQFESQERATQLIGLLSLVALAGMFVVLYILFPSTRIVLQLLNALPMAFVGGVAALVLTGQTLSVASMVGFISLGGIAARNGILLVSHYLHLMRHEGEGFTKEMVLRGSLERLAPVLMTALTAGIALIPLVLGGHQPGREILYPVATVILGGLITSTLCEYLIHPGLFWRFSGKDVDKLTRAQEEAVQTA